MTALSADARRTIKGWQPGVTIAGYVRHYSGGAKWSGDSCGCADDRCIGFHHDETADCGCLPNWLDDYARTLTPS